MSFIFDMRTDIGIQKQTNQDSMCVKQAQTNKGAILMAVVCDGMGGLDKGEVASASIIEAFSEWFEKVLPYSVSRSDTYTDIAIQWKNLIKEQNIRIGEYGIQHGIELGSTVTAMIFFEDGEYLIGHVGDCRVYRISDYDIEVLTQDQTVVAREVRQGKITAEEGESDPRKNILLQCVGASENVDPDFIEGKYTSNNSYLICTDGFRHVVSYSEIMNAFAPSANRDEISMKDNILHMISLVKERRETDNISAILIRAI